MIRIMMIRIVMIRDDDTIRSDYINPVHTVSTNLTHQFRSFDKLTKDINYFASNLLECFDCIDHMFAQNSTKVIDVTVVYHMRPQKYKRIHLAS